MLENTGDWQGKGAYLNDERKEKFFDASYHVYV
jgi:hypothetical protein